MYNRKKELSKCIVLALLIILLIIFNIFVFIVGPNNQHKSKIIQLQNELDIQYNTKTSFYNTYNLEESSYNFIDENHIYIVNEQLYIINKDDIDYNFYKQVAVSNSMTDYIFNYGSYRKNPVIAIVDDNYEYVYDIHTKDLIFKYERKL